MTNKSRNQTQAGKMREAKPGIPAKRKSPFGAWNPGSLARSDYTPMAEHKHNPRTRRMERVK